MFEETDFCVKHASIEASMPTGTFKSLTDKPEFRGFLIMFHLWDDCWGRANQLSSIMPTSS